jgi:broad specificity phosphatase PhoE
VVTEPGFDEIQTGDLDGKPMQAYWEWLAQHAAGDSLPHGESRHDALCRYAGALRRLLAGPGQVTLVVTHEYALRHIAEAAASDSWLWPDAGFANAVPYLFDDDAVRRAAASLAAPLAPAV